MAMIETPTVGTKVQIDDTNGSRVNAGDVCEVVEIDIYGYGSGCDAFYVIDKNGDKWAFTPPMVTESK
jgi:hypothetical protein